MTIETLKEANSLLHLISGCDFILNSTAPNSLEKFAKEARLFVDSVKQHTGTEMGFPQALIDDTRALVQERRSELEAKLAGL